MKTERISVSAEINAPAEAVYRIVADYRGGHPRMLPKQYFPVLEVEQGGTGAGTRLRFQMRALGSTRTFRAVVSEPKPGRVLTETSVEAATEAGEPDWTSGTVTTFTVDPLEQGRQARVTISTELKLRAGAAGWFERVLTAAFLRRVYAQELQQLASVKDAG